ncbi:MAG: DUF47 family protein [Magnetococcales bacterium]|nr:DUF47 family protein [Magnetococcales bacterium]NGZ27950.1 DUF47 family protein [Magnetococcales bacterium]
MPNQSFVLFGKTMNLERQLEEFLNLLSEANILFRGGVGHYLEEGPDSNRFQTRLEMLVKHEREVDALTRFLEANLRSQLLAGELRGDVMHLLEKLSRMQRLMVKNLADFEVERPNFPATIHPLMGQLSMAVSHAVETCIEAGQVFFQQTEKVGEYLSKVAFYEKEADKMVYQTTKAIFATDLPLYEKSHLRRFADKVDEPANIAEEIAAWLAMFFMRRGL